MNIIEKIKKLKNEKGAIILAHFYQPEEIQKIADFVGDSLELSKAAKANNANIIVFCGVDFMAGSAKLLSPNKKVLLPVIDATCPMADMITPDDIRAMRKKYPNAAVVTYINSTVETKAVSDICCTSSNAIMVVNSLSNEEIIFVPDKNLGTYVSRFTDKKIILNNGYCCIHNNITVDDVLRARANYPEAIMLVHPECDIRVIDRADFCGSTAKMLEYARLSERKEFIIGTEEGILYNLRSENKEKSFYPLRPNTICKNMKKISLEDVFNALLNEVKSIELDNDTIEKASACLNKMLAI